MQGKDFTVARGQCRLQMEIQDEDFTALDTFKDIPAAMPDSPLSRVYFGSAQITVGSCLRMFKNLLSIPRDHS